MRFCSVSTSTMRRLDIGKQFLNLIMYQHRRTVIIHIQFLLLPFQSTYLQHIFRKKNALDVARRMGFRWVCLCYHRIYYPTAVSLVYSPFLAFAERRSVFFRTINLWITERPHILRIDTHIAFEAYQTFLSPFIEENKKSEKKLYLLSARSMRNVWPIPDSKFKCRIYIIK